VKPEIAGRWFVEIDGRAQGPFKESQVHDLARLKRINPMTRIFLEGDVRWRLMNEYEQFKGSPQQNSPAKAHDGHPAPSSAEKREWVILKRKTLKEAELGQNKFDQLGPFTISEIDDQLRSGELSYNDYVWKKGFQRWARLESLSEFNHLAQPAPQPKVPEPPAVGLSWVIEPKLDLNEKEQEELDHFTATNAQALQEEVDQVIEEENEEVKPGISGRRKIVRAALASAAAGLMTFAVYTTVKEQQAPPAAPVEQTPPQASIPVPPPVAEPQVPATAPAQGMVAEVISQQQQFSNPAVNPALEKTLPKKVPSAKLTKADFEMPKEPRLELEILKPDSIGQVVFSSNAPVNQPIEVKITGKSGQILRYASYYQNLKVQRQGGEVPSIEMAALKAPFGTYTVQAKFAEVTKQKTFFYGVKDAKFQKQLDAHLKKISNEQALEKRMVVYYLRDIEELTKKLEAQRSKAAKNPAAWAKVFNNWRKDILKIGSKSFAPLRKMNNRDLAYPEIIAKARELGQTLLKQGEEMNVAIVQNRGLSSSGIPVMTDIRNFKKEVANMSRY
jgi:hypothetical protein